MTICLQERGRSFYGNDVNVLTHKRLIKKVFPGIKWHECNLGLRASGQKNTSPTSRNDVNKWGRERKGGDTHTLHTNARVYRNAGMNRACMLFGNCFRTKESDERWANRRKKFLCMFALALIFLFCQGELSPTSCFLHMNNF